MKLVVFTGPTGGHFYPALAFIEAFLEREADSKFLLVTGERGRYLVEKIPGPLREKLEIEFLPDFPFPRPKEFKFLFRVFPFLLKLIRAFWKSERILDSFRPDLCIGFGSYISFPGVLASRRRRIPTVIHEQNQKGGEANLSVSRWADRVALTFEKTEGLSASKTSWTGLPLRRTLVERAQAKRRTEPPLFSPGRLRLLILGGSQGSQSLNRLWRESLDGFPSEELKRIAVIHITGERDCEAVKAMYGAKGIEARVFPFYERMEEFYPEADLAITRAGASTLFELALFSLPAIVLPFPHAAGAHQEKNARVFEREGALVLLREADCTPGKLKQEVLELIHSREKRNRFSERLSRLAKPGAAERLVEVCLQ